VTCLNAETGVIEWKKAFDSPGRIKGAHGNYPGPRATPTVADGRVYVLSQHGALKCLAAKDGSIVWKQRIDFDHKSYLPEWYGFCSSPLLVGDTLYINHGSHGTAVDAGSGEIRWKSGDTPGGYASLQMMVHDGEKQLVVFGWDTISLVRPETGEALWTVPWKTRFDVNSIDPIPCPEGIFVSSGYAMGCAMLGPATGERIWSNKGHGSQCSPLLYREGYIYGFDAYINAGKGTLQCLEASTGEAVWKAKGITGNLIAVGGHLLVLTTQGRLLLVPATPERFVKLGDVQVLDKKSWITPAYSGGRVYCRNNDGRLACYAVDGSEL